MERRHEPVSPQGRDTALANTQEKRREKAVIPETRQHSPTHRGGNRITKNVNGTPTRQGKRGTSK